MFILQPFMVLSILIGFISSFDLFLTDNFSSVEKFVDEWLDALPECADNIPGDFMRHVSLFILK